MADPQVDMIKDMVAKGKRVVDPEYTVRYARECERLPDHRCCLALKGVSVLVTGFSSDEKTELEELVTSMDGTLQGQELSGVDFVVAKNVLATEYAWACRIVRKPVLMSSWLRQCARQHRQVPHDPHRMLPLAGIILCPTGIVKEDRDRIRKAALENGASYRGDLTEDCSHLIAVLPEGRKYQAANDRGLKVVSQYWVWESIKHDMCLDEALFTVVPPALQEDQEKLKKKLEVCERRVEDTRPSPSSEVPSSEILRGEHGWEHRVYLSMGNDMAHSDEVPGVLEAKAGNAIDLEEELVQDCLDLEIGVLNEVDEKEEEEQEEWELPPLNLEGRRGSLSYEEPECKQHVWVQRRRKFDEEFKSKVWDYGQKEKEKGAKKISWTNFCPQGMSREEKKKVDSLYSRMEQKFVRKKKASL